MPEQDDPPAPGRPDRAWRPAAATGVGSLPGTDSREAVAIVAGELPDLPHVPELPARGPGADLVGRTGGLLARVAPDLALTTTPTGWRVADAPGREARRAWSWLGEDLDALEERLLGYVGPLKTQLAGPWTLAAAVELRSGERALRDAGARRDLAHAVAEAAAAHIADLRRRVPGAAVVVQVDEPGLPGVLAGSIATQSGLSRYAPVDRPEAAAGLGAVLGGIEAAGALPAVHCCAAGVPYSLLVAAGARAVSVDLTLHRAADDVALGEALDAGVRLIAGVVPATGQVRPAEGSVVAPVLGLGSRLGFAPDDLVPRVALSPTCGLAGATPSWVRTAYAAVRAAGRLLREEEDRDVEVTDAG